MLAEPNMVFLKRLDGPGVLPLIKLKANFRVATPAPNTSGNIGLDTFLFPLLGPDMTCNELDMLIMLLKRMILILMCSRTEDVYDFIMLFTNIE